MASSEYVIAGKLSQRSFFFGILFAGVLAFLLIVSTPGSSIAAETSDDDDDSGRLNLDTTVLVNDRAGTGAFGDFPIRASLFSDRLSQEARAQAATESRRLQRVDSLDFRPSRTADSDYRPVKDSLFHDYSPVVLRSASQEPVTSPVFYWLIVVVSVPVVLVAGIFFGRMWGRRRRANR